MKPFRLLANRVFATLGLLCLALFIMCLGRLRLLAAGLFLAAGVGCCAVILWTEDEL